MRSDATPRQAAKQHPADEQASAEFRANGMSPEAERRLAKSAALAAIAALRQAHENDPAEVPGERALHFGSPHRNVRRRHPGTWRRRG